MVELSDKKSTLFGEIIKRAKMVDGVCPHCTEHTLLISVVSDYYRCLNCGGDIEQKVNGKISYLPIDLAVEEIKDERGQKKF